MMYDTDHMTTGGWILGSIMMVLLIAVVVILIVWLTRTTSQGARSDPGSRGESPRETLDRRLASSEIDEDEYRRLRAAIENPPASPAPVHIGA